MKKKCQAFTLVELLVTITVAAILFTISMPMYSEFQASSRLKISAQRVETFFGEAFSSSRSRPEHFIIEADKDLSYFEIKNCNSCECDNLQKSSKRISLNPNVKFRESFEVCFVPPFGDIKILSKNENKDFLDIEIYNTNSIFFRLYKKSGLITQIYDPENLNIGNINTIDPEKR